MQDKNIKNNELENDIATVPYFVYEAEQARSERRDRRQIIALLIAIALLFIGNLAWLYVWSQYDYETSDTSTITVDGGESGNANYIGNDGDIYGESNSNKDEKNNTNPQS